MTDVCERWDGESNKLCLGSMKGRTKSWDPRMMLRADMAYVREVRMRTCSESNDSNQRGENKGKVTGDDTATADSK
jgi:hypothetical protein